MLAVYNRRKVITTITTTTTTTTKKVQQTKYSAVYSCDDGISVLNHSLAKSKFVNTHLFYSRHINT